MKKLLWLGLGLLVVLTGCSLFSRDFSRAEELFPEDGKGMLVLVLDGGEIASKSFTWNTLNMTIARYNVTGAGPAGETFESLNVDPLTLPGQNVYSKTGLTPGDWTISVVALNNVPQEIGRGSKGSVKIVPNNMTSVTVDVLPNTGGSYVGPLNLSIVWANASIPSALVAATLTPIQPAGTAKNIGSVVYDDWSNFIIGTNTATYSKANVPAGYYTLFVNLLNGTDPVAGTTSSLRIVSGQTTTGAWDLTAVDGGATVTINPDLKNPIGITLEIASGIATATLTSNPSATYDYAWHIDGNSTPVRNTKINSTDISDAYTISGLTTGTTHNITILVTAKTGASIDSVSSNTVSYTAP